MIWTLEHVNKNDDDDGYPLPASWSFRDPTGKMMKCDSPISVHNVVLLDFHMAGSFSSHVKVGHLNVTFREIFSDYRITLSLRAPS